ncbi:MAG: NAD(P)-dependent dehydrogenase (short-subunit alcohol dehydrogenase family) [Candidatus Aldehydirespiratoraceae bacterium]|jgi:NAD(P)-dependent dehydrogenase (short-subunit alcohol dehydrogenase family)
MASIDMFDMTGRVAVVTGGSRGLGREMVLAFAEQGADVVIASRKIENCEAVAREVEALGRHALPIAYHAAEWEAADELTAAVYERFGRCDVLVNNAGMSPLYPSVEAITESLYDKVMGVNLKGPFRLSAAIGARMTAAVEAGEMSSGSIIFVSSIASQRPGPQEIIYGAAKAGVNNLTYGLSRTLGPHVRVNCIVPGPFLTDISKAWNMDAFEATAKSSLALGRGGDPSEIVGAALYLATDASSFTTGTLIDVNGGPR